MKKIMILLIFTLLFGSIILPIASFAKKDSNILLANTVFNLDPEGKNITKEKEIYPSHIKILDTNITENSIEFKGSVITEEDETPFDIYGELFKSKKSNNKIVGKLQDKTGNFNVVHFSIDSDPKKTFFIGKKINPNKGNVVKLYLLKNENRNFTYLELANPYFLKDSPFENAFNVNNLDVVDHIEEFWYAKILKPTKIEVNEENINNNEASILAMKSNEYQKTYTYTYNVIGADVIEKMIVGHYYATPDTITNQGRWYAKIRVVSEETTSDYPGFDDTDTNFKIGVYSDSYIRAYTDSGDAIDLAGWAATVLEGGLDFKISWNQYDYSFGPLTFAVLYDDYKTYTYGYTENFVNTEKLTRQAELRYKKGMKLTDPGHFYDAYFDVGHYHTSGTKYLNMQFEYDISNAMGFGTDEQTINRYLSYYSGD